VPFPNPKAASCLHSSVPFQKAGRVPRPNHAVELTGKKLTLFPSSSPLALDVGQDHIDWQAWNQWIDNFQMIR